MKIILVTGGAGYIGSKISHDLTDLGYKVIIIDNLTTGHKNLINKKAIFFKFDIGDKKKLSDVFQKYKIKTVIHLAGSLSVEESMKNPFKYYLNNVVSTKNLLEVCGLNNVEKFIFSSTCAIFGEGVKKVNALSMPNPTSHYGLTKFLCEQLIENYSKKFKFIYFNLRYFNVVGADNKLRVGPINQSGQLFKNLATNAKKKIFKLNVYGKNYNTKDGTCIRDYIDINDLSKIHINCLETKSIKKSISLNCGYGKGYSVLEIIKKFEKITGKKIKKIFRKARDGDVSEIICIPTRSSKLKKLYSNINNLENSVKSSLEWEKKILKT